MDLLDHCQKLAEQMGVLLTIHLRELEQLGFLRRQVYAQMPPKVEYSLTEQGRCAEPILRQLNAWGEHTGMTF